MPEPIDSYLGERLKIRSTDSNVEECMRVRPPDLYVGSLMPDLMKFHVGRV
jgi:hypothetical protein